MSQLAVFRGHIERSLELHQQANLEDEGGANALSGAAWNLREFLNNYCENASQFFTGATSRMNEASVAFGRSLTLSNEANQQIQLALGSKDEPTDNSIPLLHSAGKLIKAYDGLLPRITGLSEEIDRLPRVRVGDISESVDGLLGQFETLTEATKQMRVERGFLIDSITSLEAQV